jgi:uncharacterized protein DUF6603
MPDTAEQAKALFQCVVTWLKGAAQWVEETFADPAVSAALRADLGLKSEPEVTVSLPADRLAGIQAYVDATKVDKADFAQTVADVKALIDAIKAVAEVVKADGASTEEVVYQLLRLGASEHLRIRAPGVYATMRFALTITDQTFEATGIDLIGDTIPKVKQWLGAGDESNGAGGGSARPWLDESRARMITDYAAAIPILLDVVTDWPIHPFYGWDPDPASTTPNADRLSERTLTVIVGDGEGTASGQIIATFLLVPAEHGGPGMVLTLGGVGALETVRTKRIKATVDGKEKEFDQETVFRLEAALTGALSTFVPFSGSAKPFEVSVDDPRAGVSLTVSSKNPGGYPALLIGNMDGTRFEIGSYAIATHVSGDRVGATARFDGCRVVLNLGEGDGFVSGVASKELALGFDIALGADNERGFYLEGGSGLRASLPLANSRIGPLLFHSAGIQLGPAPSPKHDVSLALDTAFALTLGPVAMSVDAIGFELLLGFRAGNLGIMEIGAGFKPPKGIGLAIDAGAVKGGGYLFFDSARSEYGGVLEVKVGPVTIKALGILTTKLPDGSPGWSLLLMLFGEFSPVPLVFGFTLNGVGGVLGIQHGIAIEPLQAGMRTGVFDDVLFPVDPVANAPRLINNLRTVFPITPGALLVGPVVKLGWGSPKTLMEITLGVLFQWDNVFHSNAGASLTRITVLGKLLVEQPPRAVQKTGRRQLRLLVDILGDYDVKHQRLSIDARLRDSNVAAFDISGTLILRAVFGDDASFLLAVGGFHPDFKDLPASIPKQERVTIKFKKSIVDVRIEGYFAVTSNTFQVGAAVYAEASKWGFTVKGWLGFDVLFEFEPVFHFVGQMKAGVAVKYKGWSLTSVDLTFTLTGPGYWTAVGKAKIDLLFGSKTISFNEEWGTKPPTLTETVNVAALLLQRLSEPGAWSARQPVGGEMLVSLRTVQGNGHVMVHPLGQIAVTQKLIPLRLEIDKLGNAKPVGLKRFEIAAMDVGGVVQPATAWEYTKEHFAAAQYINMSEAKKLARESFEQFDAGAAVKDAGITAAPTRTSVVAEFETIYFTPLPPAMPKPPRYTPTIARSMRHARRGAAAQSPLRKTSKRFVIRREVVRVLPPTYAAVDTDKLAQVGVPARGSYTAVAEAVRAAGKATDRKIQIIETFELTGAV